MKKRCQYQASYKNQCFFLTPRIEDDEGTIEIIVESKDPSEIKWIDLEYNGYVLERSSYPPDFWFMNGNYECLTDYGQYSVNLNGKKYYICNSDNGILRYEQSYVVINVSDVSDAFDVSNTSDTLDVFVKYDKIAIGIDRSVT